MVNLGKYNKLKVLVLCPYPKGGAAGHEIQVRAVP